MGTRGKRRDGSVQTRQGTELIRHSKPSREMHLSGVEIPPPQSVQLEDAKARRKGVEIRAFKVRRRKEQVADDCPRPFEPGEGRS